MASLGRGDPPQKLKSHIQNEGVVCARLGDWNPKADLLPGSVLWYGNVQKAMRALEIVADRRSKEPDKARTDRVLARAAGPAAKPLGRKSPEFDPRLNFGAKLD